MPLTPALVSSLTAAAIAQTSPFRIRLTFAGRDHFGCRASANNARTYRPEGYTADYKYTWLGNAAEFPKPPDPKTRLMVDGALLRVAAVEIDPAGGLIRIDLADPGAE